MNSTFRMPQFRLKRTSHLALAVALASGAVLGVTGFAEPALAAKKDKKENKGGDYSKEFVAAYEPASQLAQADPVDVAALKAAVPGVIAVTSTPDEKLTAGSLVYNTGVKANDNALRYQGMEMMISSGKLPAENVPTYNYMAYELARDAKNWTAARGYLKTAMDTGFTHEKISATDMQRGYAMTFFNAGDTSGGIDYLKSQLDAASANGGKADEALYNAAIAAAYKAKAVPALYGLTSDWVAAYPTTKNWRDAVNITRNLNDFTEDQLLDALRLSNRLKVMNSKEDYLVFVEAADPRKLPKEVLGIIDSGYASGNLERNDSYISEMRTLANGRLKTDQAELPSLEKDARASSASLKTVTAAGDTFLSYGQPAKAEEFYTKALTMPGADTAQVLTRLGIAQIDQGKYDVAQTTLAKVTGPRESIARLWIAFAKQGGAAPTT